MNLVACRQRQTPLSPHNLRQVRGVTAITILLVDKELGIREVGRQVLKQTGFQVESTGNGTKALKMLRSRNYSLVITDLLHPGLNEAELIGKILRRESVSARAPSHGFTHSHNCKTMPVNSSPRGDPTFFFSSR